MGHNQTGSTGETAGGRALQLPLAGSAQTAAKLVVLWVSPVTLLEYGGRLVLTFIGGVAACQHKPLLVREAPGAAPVVSKALGLAIEICLWPLSPWLQRTL